MIATIVIAIAFFGMLWLALRGAYLMGKAQVKPPVMPPRDAHGRFLSAKALTTAALRAELDGKGAA